MSAPSTKTAEALSGALSPSCRKTAAHALTIVRDGVITGEGPTTKGRIHFSRSLDADDAAWCARILTAAAVEHQPVSRAEDRGAVRDQRGRGRAQRWRPVRRPARQGDRPSCRVRVRPAGAAAHRGAVARGRDRSLGADAGRSRSTPKFWNGSPARCAVKRRSRSRAGGDGGDAGRRGRAAARDPAAQRVRHRDDVIGDVIPRMMRHRPGTTGFGETAGLLPRRFLFAGVLPRARACAPGIRRHRNSAGRATRWNFSTVRSAVGRALLRR